MKEYVVTVECKIEDEYHASIKVPAHDEADARAKVEQMIEDEVIDIENEECHFWAIDGDHSGYHVIKIEPYDENGTYHPWQRPNDVKSNS